MKDSVNTLFQQRFQGHEAPVDPAVWQGIEQQLAATAPSADAVNELFKKRFQGHEVPVDPAVWSSISGQLGHTVTTGTAASAIWGWAAAGVTAIALGTAVLWGTGAEKPVAQQVLSTPVEAPASAIPYSTPATGAADLTTSEPTPNNTAATSTDLRPQLTRPIGAEPNVTTTFTAGAEATPTIEQPGVEAVAPVIDGNSSIPGELIVKSIIEELTTEVKKEAHTEPTADQVRPEPGELDGIDHPNEAGTVASDLPKLFMPNTFTPNGDLINDTYTVGSEGFVSLMLRVYSLKTNALVFSTNSGEAWTGANCEDGMYMVAAEARTADGRTVTDGKVVWLNRNPMN